MSPNQSESDAMAAFLAARSGNISLEERARLWSHIVELIAKRPKEIVEQMEKEKGLK